MAHCPYSDLGDLERVLAEIRDWTGIREPKPGVFYLRGKPFLHFHVDDSKRWADARCGREWGPALPIPRPANENQRRSFLASVRKYYRTTFSALGA